MASSAKQAVLLIHGIGEQRPMDTLRGFVHAVWTTDPAVKHAHAVPGIFSKPDEISGSYELRRLTTTMDANGVRTDFYEFYWAHLMEGTQFGHVLAWARRLLVRWPWSVPERLRGAWVLLVGILAVVVFLALQTVLPEAYRVVAVPKWLTGLLGILTAWGAVPLINSIVGDAARYLNPAPVNIHRRQEIRARGVEILKKLHESGVYQRIIIVGHSLGSVIGYDLLTYAWPMYAGMVDSKMPHPVLDGLEGSVAQSALAQGSLTAAAYQAEQRKLLRELQAHGCNWLVTDFVTLGSPLTHAEILLAHSQADLASKQAERELPTCPPVLESGRFSFPHDRVRRTLHHAAVFGPTRWSNVYFPAAWVVRGDLVGGPLSGAFGQGIRDHRVSTTHRGGFLSHTLYWWTMGGNPPEPHITDLRTVLNLLDA